jgi:hypothetical protein
MATTGDPGVCGIGDAVTTVGVLVGVFVDVSVLGTIVRNALVGV